MTWDIQIRPGSDLDRVSFEFDRPPPSKKNRTKQKVGKSGKSYPGKGDEVKAFEDALRWACLQSRIFRRQESLFVKDDVRVELDHIVRSDRVVMTVFRQGPPKSVDGKTGRRLDVHNLLAAPIDALQGFLFDDDNQVIDARMRRVTD